MLDHADGVAAAIVRKGGGIIQNVIFKMKENCVMEML